MTGESGAALSQAKKGLVFDDRRLATLTALLDSIIPPDAETPGGVAGGSLAYLLDGLAEGGHLNALLPAYQELLDALDTVAVFRGGAFAALAPETRDELLRSLEEGTPILRAPWTEEERRLYRDLFFQLAEQAQEGYYTNPANWAGVGFVVQG